MRIHKISKFLFFLLCIFNLKIQAFNLAIKKLQDSKSAKIFDVYVFVDRNEPGFRSQSEINSQEKNTKKIVDIKKLILMRKINNFFKENNDKQVSIREIINFIEDEKTIIISINLLKSLMEQSEKNLFEEKEEIFQNQENLQYKESLKDLFSRQSCWNIFATKNKHFVTLISHSKYPEPGKKCSLKEMGLNPKRFFSIKIFDKRTLKKNLKKLNLFESKNKLENIKINKEKDIQNKENNAKEESDVDSLFDIFLHEHQKDRTLLWK